MNVYIKEWPNKTATILTSNGQVIWTFSSVAEARQVCADWHGIVYAGDASALENPCADEASCCCLA